MVSHLPRRDLQRLLGAAAEALSIPRLLDRASRREALVDGVLEAISDQAAVLDGDGVVVQANTAWTQTPGDHRAVVERSPIGSDYPAALRSQQSRSAGIAADGILGVLTGALPNFQSDYDAGERAYSLQVDPLPTGGAVVRHVDISFRKHLQRQLAHRATHDSLTGLPNRMVMVDRLGQALIRAARTSSGVALLFADVDRFKQINDALGHGVGDQVLAAVGRRLQSAVRQSDLVARFGGDEFVVLLEDIDNDDAAVAFRPGSADRGQPSDRGRRPPPALRTQHRCGTSPGHSQSGSRRDRHVARRCRCGHVRGEAGRAWQHPAVRARATRGQAGSRRHGAGAAHSRAQR